MDETVLFSSESEQTRASVAAYLRMVANSLESGEGVTLKAGDRAVELHPPARPTFEVRAAREEPTTGLDSLRVGFELGWSEGGGNEETTDDTGGDTGWYSNDQ
jgi:amphi-Trp domain-containing protein